MACRHPTLKAASGGACPLCPRPVIESDKLDVSNADALSQVTRQLCLKNLSDFVRASWHTIEPGVDLEGGWHIDAIAMHVQAQIEDAMRAARTQKNKKVFRQRYRDLVINAPPRSIKTTIVCVCAVAWAWLKWPHLKIVTLSANPRVPANVADSTKKMIKSDWYQKTFLPDWQIRDDKDGVSAMANSRGGLRAARGLGSTITGEGFDWIQLDDPNDAKDVWSQLKREEIANSWKRVSSRVNNPKTSWRTCVAQRTHYADLAADLINQGWNLLKIPATLHKKAEPNFLGWVDPREVGERMHARLDDEFLSTSLKDLGSQAMAAQFDQDPVPEGGNMFKLEWFKRYEALPESFDRIVMSVDSTFKESGTSRVGIMVLGVKGADRFVLHAHASKMGFSATCEKIAEISKAFPKLSLIYIEDKANGEAINDALKARFNIKLLTPQGGKMVRAKACEPAIETGHVYLPRFAPWLDELECELVQFPNYKYDDLVDCLTQALTALGTSGGFIWRLGALA